MCANFIYGLCCRQQNLFSIFCILNEIVHMKLLVTKRKAMWSPKAVGAKVLVFTLKNAGK